MVSSQGEEQHSDIQDNPQARETLQKAFEQTARWQPDFKGFTANLQINIDGKATLGTVTVKGPQEVQVEMADADIKEWAQKQIGMIAVHRGPRSFAESDGKYSLTLDTDSAHPLGPRLYIHGDGMQSHYRVKGDRITQINRKTPHMAFTINVEESATTASGHFLTTKYTVYYYSPKDGSLTNVDSITDTHTRVGSSDLPATRRIISFANGSVLVKTMTFEHHAMLS